MPTGCRLRLEGLVTQSLLPMESYEAGEIGRYTSLSTLAVCAFVLGLASLTALLAPFMMVVPIAGVIVSATALARIAGSSGTLSGRNLALVGLALSIACGVASPLRVEVRDRLYASQVDQAGRDWLTLLSKDQLAKAVDQLTGNAKAHLVSSGLSDGPSENSDPQDSINKLRQQELTTKLLEEAEHGALEFATLTIQTDTHGAAPRAKITYQTVKPDESLTINLVLLQWVSEKQWLIDSWALEGEGSHSHDHGHVH